MKKRNILPAGLLAAAALATLAGRAQAQTVTASAGDLLLGFNEPGVSNDYVVDLGPASYFETLASTPGTTDITTADYSGTGLGNIANDLSTVFGTSWYANSSTVGSNLQWGIAGATATHTGTPPFGIADTLFFTVGELTPGSGSTGPAAYAASTQDNPAKAIIQGLDYNFTGLSDTSNSAYAAVESHSGSDYWSSYSPGLSAFGEAGVNIEQPTSGSYIGPTNSQLDLYELLPTNHGGTANGTELGSFTLTSNGDLNFTSAAAVPEPSTYAAVGLGAAFLLLFRRRSRSVIPG